MASKITTAICKNALVAAWPAIFGSDLAAQSSRWKRISKRGKSGEPIERLFYHQSLPLQALVVEENNGITKTTIRGFAPFDADEESGSEAESEMGARGSSNESFEFFSKYACYKPSDFIFKLCSEEDAASEGEVWYELYPTRDFGRAECSYDEQVDVYIKTFLPEGDGEAMEGTFVTERSIPEARAELIRLGFIPDEQFVNTSRAGTSGGDED